MTAISPKGIAERFNRAKERRSTWESHTEQAYQAGDLAMLAQHIFGSVVEQDYDDSDRLFHLVMADGSMATVTVFRAEQVTAWTRQETDGLFRSVAVVDGATFVLVERDGAFRIEVFDSDLHVDSGLAGSVEDATETWSGLDHLEGRTVKVLADGAVCPDAVVADGTVVLDDPASVVQIGLGYTHVVEPLPPSISEAQNASQGGKIRLVRLTLRLQDTAAVRLDTGRGFVELPFKRFGVGVLDGAPPTFTRRQGPSMRSAGARAAPPRCGASNRMCRFPSPFFRSRRKSPPTNESSRSLKRM